MKLINKVTVTGADESVKPKDLIDLAKEFPFVEYGILMSRGSSMGKNRMPSFDWLDDFVDEFKNKGVAISGHVCGSWVKEIYSGSWPFTEIHHGFSRLTNRWQFNTHGETHNYNLYPFMALIDELNQKNQQVIFQFDKENNIPLKRAVDLGLNVSALFDLSHGTGILPEVWEVPQSNIYCGFAGGLSPNNVKEQIEKMRIVTEVPFWIDAETHLRSEDDKKFDLKKVRDFLKTAEPFTV